MVLKFPKIPGLEAAGEIISVGTEVKVFNIGDKVILCTGLKGGCCAEFYSAKESHLYSMPEGISYNEAAASSITGLTALQAIRDIAYVNSETRILINGASGGVGVAAVQIAKIFEGKVTALCSESNIEFVKNLGADEVYDYNTTDILTLGMKFDAVFDTIGNMRFANFKKILNKGGIFISTAPDPAYFMGMAINNLKSTKKMKVVILNINPDDMKWLQVELESNRLKVPIDSIYPLSEIKEAHDYSESGHVKGKIVVSFDV